MKITLDLTELVERGQPTAVEAERLKGLAAKDSGTLGSNIFLGFGAVAVVLGVGVMVPTPQTAILLGIVLFGLGFSLRMGRQERWALLSQICMTIGALAVTSGVWLLSVGTIEVLLALTLALAGAAVLARSGLLAALSVLVLASALGSGTGYFFATYGVWVTRPGLSIAVLAVLTLGLHLISLRVPAAYERLALIGARTAILIMNLAFLVGSLFGDDQLDMDRTVFTVGWAVALIAVAIWAVRANRRWVVNTAAVFGALHFYTQWFEALGPSPVSVLGGGVLLIAFGLALRWLNRKPAITASAA